MSIAYLITHPEVIIDPAVPVPEWELSERGLARLEAMLRQPWVRTIGAIYSSTERKAAQAAARLGSELGLEVVYWKKLAEIDRSSTGYLKLEEHDRLVAALFDFPERSARGWERAVDAQQRIVAAVERALGQSPNSAHVAIVAHGGVGALLLYHLRGTAIGRSELPGGQGKYFAFERETGRVLHGWRGIDEVVERSGAGGRKTEARP